MITNPLIEKRVMTKNIVEEINDKEMEKGLVLNTSYDIFYLGKSISKYENLVHYKKNMMIQVDLMITK